MQLYEGEKQLRSTMGSDSGAPPTGVVDIKVPKQYMVGRVFRKGNGHKGKNLMGIKWERLIRRLIFSRIRGDRFGSVHIVDHNIVRTRESAPEV